MVLFYSRLNGLRYQKEKKGKGMDLDFFPTAQSRADSRMHFLKSTTKIFQGHSHQ